jgi:alpha-L-fucosidase
VPRRSVLAVGPAAVALAAMNAASPIARAAETVAAPLAQSGGGNRYWRQKALVDARFGQFLHFNMGTFTDQEWADPSQDPKTFAPITLDCAQWAAAAKAAGMRFAILTAKHHDGFCLWPTKLTSYNVMNSGYPHDVVRQFVDAYRAAGVTPCLYLSIWDRTTTVAPPVTRAMINYVKGQITELLTWYGPIPLLIFDGWAWNFGHGPTPGGVPFGEIRTHVASLQPDCVVMDLTGLSTAWESDLTFYEEAKGGIFCPQDNTVAATQGTSISASGWFWHPATPNTLMTAEQIVAGHLSVLEPRYCTFILNTPPNRQGLLDAAVVSTLKDAGAMWRPGFRPPLPSQPDVLTYPVMPVTAAATSGNASLAIDGISDFGWNGEATQTLCESQAGLPQSITFDLGHVYQGIDHLTYLPRQDTATPYTFAGFATEGDITSYRVLVSASGRAFREVARGSWAADHTLKHAYFRSATARYVRLDALGVVGTGGAITSEIDTGGLHRPPRRG